MHACIDLIMYRHVLNFEALIFPNLMCVNCDFHITEDMRRYVPTELSDIMVSELLGSWGDNELSPECLDIAQETCLKPDGVSTAFEIIIFYPKVFILC